MKTHGTQTHGLITVLAVLSLAVGLQFSTSFAQGSAFSYQGRLIGVGRHNQNLSNAEYPPGASGARRVRNGERGS